MRVRLLVTPDVLTEGRIAITATDVPTLRSLQLKGRIADVEPMTDDDLAKSEQYTDDFYDDIVSTDHIPRDLLERVRPREFVDVHGGGRGALRPDARTARGHVGAMTQDEDIVLSSLRECFEGAIPAIIATASAAGIPNVTYLSRVPVRRRRAHRALEPVLLEDGAQPRREPRASMVLVDPTTYDEYRLTVVFERTVRRGADLREAARRRRRGGRLPRHAGRLQAQGRGRVPGARRSSVLNEPYARILCAGSQARPARRSVSSSLG